MNEGQRSPGAGANLQRTSNIITDAHALNGVDDRLVSVHTFRSRYRRVAGKMVITPKLTLHTHAIRPSALPVQPDWVSSFA